MSDDPESVVAKLQRRLMCMTQTMYIIFNIIMVQQIRWFGKARTPTICAHLVQFVIQGNMTDVYSKTKLGTLLTRYLIKKHIPCMRGGMGYIPAVHPQTEVH